MYSVLMTARIPGRDRDEVFDTIADFERYAELVDAVRDVRVEPPVSDRSVVSHWEVIFRKGLLRWSESDTFDRRAGVISFTQLDGDFDVFRGSWLLESTEGGTSVVFRSVFDFGVPSMAGIIDPVAGRVLLENMELILHGLFASASMTVTTAEHGPVLDDIGSLELAGAV